MPTTVHIPEKLLTALDTRAKQLGISRNRLVVQAVERELRERDKWPPGFIERLRKVTPSQKRAVDEMMTAIRNNRSSKGPPF
ncbi:MAG: YlcI/YnfO family protein [Acidimicrobiia bacterium]